MPAFYEKKIILDTASVDLYSKIIYFESFQAESIDQDLEVTTNIVVPEIKVSTDPAAAKAGFLAELAQIEEAKAILKLEKEKLKAEEAEKKVIEEQIALVEAAAREEQAAKQSEGLVLDS